MVMKEVGGLAQEFKKFISRGNVVDMAVGVIVGGAFGKIVSSLVGDVVMPAVGMVTGKVDLAKLEWVLRAASSGPDGAERPAVAIRYGAFLQSALDFLLIALCIFLALKVMAKLNRRRSDEVAPAAPAPAPDPKFEVLSEIRDLLKEHK